MPTDAELHAPLPLGGVGLVSTAMDSPESSQLAEPVRRSRLALRVALTLFLHGGCTYEQIGNVLSVTVEAVRSMLQRARTALRVRLDGLL